MAALIKYEKYRVLLVKTLLRKRDVWLSKFCLRIPKRLIPNRVSLLFLVKLVE
jgi:hypothetical protein